MQLPPSLEAELKRLGVVVREQDVVQQPVKRDFTFKTPVFDEDGQPNF